MANMEKQLDGDAILVQAYEALALVQGTLAALKREIVRLQAENARMLNTFNAEAEKK
jgi:hypothetical protein